MCVTGRPRSAPAGPATPSALNTPPSGSYRCRSFRRWTGTPRLGRGWTTMGVPRWTAVAWAP